MIQVNRRSLVIGAGLALGAVATGPSRRTVRAQGAPGAADGMAGTIRIRTSPAPELRANVLPFVMANYVPALREVPGYQGYLYAWDNADPARTISLLLLESEDVRPAAEEAYGSFRTTLDERLKADPTLDRDGTIAVGDVAPANPELPAGLHGCAIVLRDWVVNEGVDQIAEGEKVRAGLVPMLQAMDGYVGFYWMPGEAGPAVLSIFRTVEQIEASNELAKNWVAENAPDVTKGPPTIYEGTIQFAEGVMVPS